MKQEQALIKAAEVEIRTEREIAFQKFIVKTLKEIELLEGNIEDVQAKLKEKRAAIKNAKLSDFAVSHPSYTNRIISAPLLYRDRYYSSFNYLTFDESAKIK